MLAVSLRWIRCAAAATARKLAGSLASSTAAPARADRAEGGLESYEPTVRRRTHVRADRLGAEGQRNHPRGHRGGGAARRAARRAREIPGVARGRRVVGGEFRRVTLAEQDGPRA